MIRFLGFISLFMPLILAGNSPNYSVIRAKVVTSKSANPFVRTYTAFAEHEVVRAGPRPLRVQSFATVKPQLVVLPKVTPVQAPVTVPFNVRDEPYDSNPQYNFAYQVHDSSSGTNHGHSEARDGDVVNGQYTVLDPDGYFRVVTYTSDPVNGFNAVVDRQPLAKREPVAIQSPVYAQAPPPLPFGVTVGVTPKLQYSFSSYATPGSSYGYSF